MSEMQAAPSTPAPKRKSDEEPRSDDAVSDTGSTEGSTAKRTRSEPHPLDSGYDISAESSDDPYFSGYTSTHDTAASSFHYPSIQELAKDLQAALESSWKTRQDPGCSKYKAVKAFLVSWEDDDLGVQTELDELGQLFEGVYFYEIEKWKIPSVDSQEALDERVRDLIKRWQTPSSLLIFYYAGHARPSRHMGTYPVWASQRYDPKEVYPLSIQLYLENASCDVLFLYDCCHSIHARGGIKTCGIKEALAAGGFETIAAEVGEHSFTNLLTHELASAAAQGRGISVSDLHGHMLAGLGEYRPRILKDNKGKFLLDSNSRPGFEPPRRRTPVHYFVSLKHESIVLAPLRAPQQPMAPPPPRQFQGQTSAAPDSNNNDEIITINAAEKFPQVILSIRLESSEEINAAAFRDWLLQAPPEAKNIKVEGWFGSFSTLILLNLPLNVWHMMPDNPAVSFVGFVTTENLASALQPRPNPNIAMWQDGVDDAASVFADSAVDLDGRSVTFHDAGTSKPKAPAQAPALSGVQHPADYRPVIWSSIGEFRRRLHRKSKPLDPDLEDLNLSCPFRKRNPTRFNVRDYQSCALQSFSDISQLKRHVKLFHSSRSEPTNTKVCPRCKKRIGSKKRLDEHLGAPSNEVCTFREGSESDNPEDGIDAKIRDLLNDRRTNSKVDNWAVMWGVLFPADGVNRIPDPEFEPPIELEEGIEMLLRKVNYLETKLNSAISQTLSEVKSHAGSGPGATTDMIASLLPPRMIEVLMHQIQSVYDELCRRAENSASEIRRRRKAQMERELTKRTKVSTPPTVPNVAPIRALIPRPGPLPLLSSMADFNDPLYVSTGMGYPPTQWTTIGDQLASPESISRSSYPEVSVETHGWSEHPPLELFAEGQILNLRSITRDGRSQTLRETDGKGQNPSQESHTAGQLLNLASVALGDYSEISGAAVRQDEHPPPRPANGSE